MANKTQLIHPTVDYDPSRDRNDHALIGVSPFNGYFSADIIENLIRWSSLNFKSFDLFTMDGASKYNLMAMGYSEEDALKKTMKQDKHLRNKIIRGFEKMGYTQEEALKKIVLISQLKTNERYLELYEFYLLIFKNNPAFRQDCLNASKTILPNKDSQISDDTASIAVKYLLQEIPIWFNSPYILGIESSVFVYKDLPHYWRNVCYNYDLISPNQKLYIKQI